MLLPRTSADPARSPDTRVLRRTSASRRWSSVMRPASAHREHSHSAGQPAFNGGGRPTPRGVVVQLAGDCLGRGGLRYAGAPLADQFGGGRARARMGFAPSHVEGGKSFEKGAAGAAGAKGLPMAASIAGPASPAGTASTALRSRVRTRIARAGLGCCRSCRSPNPRCLLGRRCRPCLWHPCCPHCPTSRRFRLSRPGRLRLPGRRCRRPRLSRPGHRARPGLRRCSTRLHRSS